MGLTADTQAAIAEAFDTDLADAVLSFTLKQYLRGQYSATTGALAGVSFPISSISRGVFASYNQPEILNSNIEPTDIKLIVLQNELSLEPRIGDIIVKSDDTQNFRIINIVKDPAKVIWELQIRGVE